MFDAFADDSDTGREDKPAAPEDEGNNDKAEEEVGSDGEATDENQDEEEEEAEAAEDMDVDEEDEEEEEEEEEADAAEDMDVDEEEEEVKPQPKKKKKQKEKKKKKKAKLTSRVRALRHRDFASRQAAADPCRAFRVATLRRLVRSRVGVIRTTSRRRNQTREVDAVVRVNGSAARLLAYYLSHRATELVQRAQIIAEHSRRKMITRADTTEALRHETDVHIVT